MKRILQIIGFVGLTLTGAKAQTYLLENFENPFVGNPAAPSGWTQTRINLLGDGIPEGTTTDGEKDWQQNFNTGVATWSISTPGTFPNAAVSGSNALYMNDYYFGSTGNAFGTRRMESPVINLASATSPYVRFWFFCAYASDRLQVRVVASNDGGTTWNPIMTVAPNFQQTVTVASSSPWQRINVKIPSAYFTSNTKIGVEMTNSWGTNPIFIDDVSVEEFTPTTITSAGTGLWSNTATWVGGIIPNADNNVVIAASHVVNLDNNITRCQDMTINGTLQYNGTSTAQLFQNFGNLTINAGGTYFSGNGTTGKRSYFGGSITNNGTLNFQPGTSITGCLVWLGFTGNYSGTGVITNNRVPVVVHAAPGGVQYASSFTISNTCDLYLGTVNASNLVLGNPPAAVAFNTERYLGAFSNAPTFNNTNVTQRNLSFVNPLGAVAQGGFWLGLSQAVITPGSEVELISGNRQVTGALTMNTHNNVQLAYPLSVGTATGTQNITLTRGIIISTNINPLILMQSATGAVGALPTTISSNGTNGGNHGSYVNGPVRINFPSTGTTTRNFPLGSGTAFHTNLPSSNVLRNLVLAAGVTAWNSQTITATIENAPSGAVNTPINLIMGSRAYRLNMNGGPALAASNILTMRFTNSTFGGSDNLLGNLQDIRMVQSANLTGPWTERSTTTGAGLIAVNTNYIRSNATTAPGPINNGDEYFAWGSTGAAVDMAATSLVSPANVGCYGPNQSVSVLVTNSGIAPMDFSVNNATITSNVSGAVNQTFTPVVLTSGTLAVGASQTVNITNTFNMSSVGVYSFNATISTNLDVNLINDVMPVVTRTVIAPLGFPYSQDFNSSLTLPVGMVASGSAPMAVTANHGANYNNNALTRNLYGTTFTTSILDLPKLGQATANSYLTYDYRIQDWSGYPSSAATSLLDWANDSLNVYVSTNCGLTYSLVQSINASNHTPTIAMTTKTLSLGSFAGSDLIVRFIAKKDAAGSGDYYADLDNINVFTPLPDDVAAIELAAPGLVGCYSSSEPVSIKLINYGVNTQTSIPVTVVVSGVINQTLTGTYVGSLPSTGTVNFNIGNINMSAAGVYSFNATTGLVGDNNPGNDAMIVQTRTVVAPIALPYAQDFNASLTLPTGMTSAGSPAYAVFANHGANYNNNALSGNLYGTTFTLASVNLPKMGTVTANSTLSYDYRIQDWSGYPSSAATSTANWANDSLNVYVSIDCGLTYSLVQSNNASNHTPTISLTTKTVNLAPFAGNDIIIRFTAKKDPAGFGDYYADLDNINICAGPPNAPVASATSICTGTSAIITSTVTGMSQWYASPSATSALATGTLYTTPILTTSTTYYVLDSAACGISSLTAVNVTVNALPSVTITPSNSSVCSGNSATLTVTGANTYSWSNSATTSVIVVSPTVSTTYSVIGSANGCPDSNGSQLININPSPSLNIVANNSTICAGASVNLTASGASSYTWNTSATTTSIVVTPTSTTIYSVTGTSTLGCVGNKTISITVNAKPSLTLTAGTTTACLNGGAITLTGTPSGGVYSGPNVTGNVLNPTALGTFNPIYTYTDIATSCTNSTSISILVSNCTGLNNITANSEKVSVYPNPNNGEFVIDAKTQDQKEVQIIDITGRIISEFKSTDETIQVNINDLAKGLYYVNIKINSLENKFMIIKQ